MRKVLFVMLAVAVVGGIFTAGYEFGQYLAKRENTAEGQEVAASTNNG